VPPGGVEIRDPVWRPWHPREVADRLRGIDLPWGIAGGWALDLFLGRETRQHDDVEIAIPALRFHEVRPAFAEYEFHVVGDGRRWPFHQAMLDRTYQTWLFDPGASVYRLDVFREPHDGDTWICRRAPDIRLPYAEVTETAPDGVAYLRPEIVLLFKAKAARPKDVADLAVTLPAMTAARRRWLADALDQVHPGHPWIGQLRAAA
jgi:Aminoglycoside-2''-adenylyltransferase